MRMGMSDKNQSAASGGFAVKSFDRNVLNLDAMFIPSIMEGNLI